MNDSGDSAGAWEHIVNQDMVQNITYIKLNYSFNISWKNQGSNPVLNITYFDLYYHSIGIPASI